jgi:hypothetical protein
VGLNAAHERAQLRERRKPADPNLPAPTCLPRLANPGASNPNWPIPRPRQTAQSLKAAALARLRLSLGKRAHVDEMAGDGRSGCHLR